MSGRQLRPLLRSHALHSSQKGSFMSRQQSTMSIISHLPCKVHSMSTRTFSDQKREKKKYKEEKIVDAQIVEEEPQEEDPVRTAFPSRFFTLEHQLHGGLFRALQRYVYLEFRRLVVFRLISRQEWNELCRKDRDIFAAQNEDYNENAHGVPFGKPRYTYVYKPDGTVERMNSWEDGTHKTRPRKGFVFFHRILSGGIICLTLAIIFFPALFQRKPLTHDMFGLLNSGEEHDTLKSALEQERVLQTHALLPEIQKYADLKRPDETERLKQMIKTEGNVALAQELIRVRSHLVQVQDQQHKWRNEYVGSRGDKILENTSPMSDASLDTLLVAIDHDNDKYLAKLANQREEAAVYATWTYLLETTLLCRLSVSLSECVTTESTHRLAGINGWMFGFVTFKPVNLTIYNKMIDSLNAVKTDRLSFDNKERLISESKPRISSETRDNFTYPYLQGDAYDRDKLGMQTKNELAMHDIHSMDTVLAQFNSAVAELVAPSDKSHTSMTSEMRQLIDQYKSSLSLYTMLRYGPKDFRKYMHVRGDNLDTIVGAPSLHTNAKGAELFIKSLPHRYPALAYISTLPADSVTGPYMASIDIPYRIMKESPRQMSA